MNKLKNHWSMKTKILLFFTFISFSLSAQVDVGQVHIIDDSNIAEGITKIASADLNNDGFPELLVSQSYNSDRIVVYWNDGNANFTSEVIDTNFPEAIYVTAADINGNGFKDILAISQTNGILVWYPNTNGNFGNRTTIDTENSFGKGIIPGDFDEDGSQDLVVIWQHAFNFYRNNGSGTFTKEPITTTATDPDGLECWTITQGDVNQDGHLDVITGQTLGSAVYENDGTGNFTKQVISIPAHSTVTAQAVIDVNNDNFPDFIMKRASGFVSLYLNPGDSSFDFTYNGDLLPAILIEDFAVDDVDNDGNSDFYFADQGVPYLRLSGNTMDFSGSVPLNVNGGLFINHVLTADIDNDGENEFIWSAVAGTLAYQDNEALAIKENEQNEFMVYPNPASTSVYVQTNSSSTIIDFSLVDLQGKLIKQGKITSDKVIDVQKFPDGIYFLKLFLGGKKLKTEKIMVSH